MTLTMTLKDPKPDSYGLMRYIFNGMKRGCTVYLPKSMFENGKASEEITISGAGLVMPPNPEIVSSLREENEALRKRLAELEKGRG